ncbi:MAG: agmatine deiminase family protein [Candidatus Cloacimonetes bacterium]|nr:agmatine deiminase family protein [Candidatus Cloacimonadota bacterium]MCK9178461.1 agmatine deiminase family protein [Candidatus Cloacimonadota bacterium]MDD3102692.1 agmatine deiminase family protein [Candidatus Cloacimonadota bacterium]MDD3533829.1 agmatine deiminase family protein [Candidatus Cloacimonadota bacterium]
MMKISQRILIIICLSLSLGNALQADQSSDLPFAWDQRFTQTSPPISPVRPIAEFEPASDVMIRYPLGIPTALVAELAETANVLCLVNSSSQINAAQNSFSSAGVNLARVSFMVASTDSYWVRDYAPWFLYDGNGDYGVLDFRYNRPRPGDNMIPQLYADVFDLPYYGMNLYQTGGNYMTDGINTAAQTQIAYSENSNNQANVNSLMQDFLGITNFHVVQDPNNTYIDHIDCWGKFLAVDKILIRSVPPSHPQYSEIEAVANYFSQQICAWGYPYRVYRVNTPQNQPYSNSLILNRRVFVPIMNSSHDNAALQVYAQAMPGYEIIGVAGSAYTPWESTDALHCRTHEIPDADMLQVSHQPYFGNQDYSEEYALLAEIVAHSGAELNADSLFVAYKFNSSDWQYSLLSPAGAYNYQSSITGHAPGDTIRYFIQAADHSGRKRSQPDFAGLDPHIFVVEGDAQGPALDHEPITSIGKEEVTLIVLAEDEAGISSVTITHKVDAGAEQSHQMIYGGNNLYLYSILPDFAEEDEYFYYQIIAEDSFGNLSYLPAENQWYEASILPVSNPGDISVPQAPGLKIYPNPLGKGRLLSIDYQQDKAGAALISIFNLRGQLVYEKELFAQQGVVSWDGRDKSGNLSTSGIYFLRFKNRDTERNCKLIIAH